jgi:hypothetical protein
MNKKKCLRLVEGKEYWVEKGCPLAVGEGYSGKVMLSERLAEELIHVCYGLNVIPKLAD